MKSKCHCVEDVMCDECIERSIRDAVEHVSPSHISPSHPVYTDPVQWWRDNESPGAGR